MTECHAKPNGACTWQHCPQAVVFRMVCPLNGTDANLPWWLRTYEEE